MKNPKNMRDWDAMSKEEQEEYLKAHPLFEKKLKIARHWSELIKDWEEENKELMK